ncbi:AAA family ATPase [Cellulomonas marina]|uniref:MinD-like ATPase involved in chromosome partitioning or flagellar assembly n=1 Tax=Cellulomonas marina TaxID=988821 RepID=A0A1I0V2T9_9CELL|nr:hypothetical protein [Cellulomonas marina]GIG28244.1 hypothetical protein Cma02nite_08440 [Cellulomonas marina]SFA69866.1 MinD-like ATPase involved in chromosome partitioning or flagellar assembly [Cellulomonas marina]
MTVPVLTALPGVAEALLVAAAGRSPRLDVVRRCADLAELLAAAEAGLGSVALLSGALAHLDHDALAALRGSGALLVGVAAPGDEREADRLRAWGVDALVLAPGDDAAADAVVREVLAALARREATDPAGTTGGHIRQAGTGSPAPWSPPPVPPRRAEPASSGSRPAAPTEPPPARGQLVAVWGPTGAPGRTTVAVTLAAELAALGHRTLLADADTYGGSVAATVGMLDEAPGLAAAARAAAQGGLDLPTLARHSPLLAPGLRVLSGLARADRWPELGPAALDVVWDRARDLAAVTVVDTGFCLEEDELLSYDTRAPRRNAATTGALDAADTVVAVGSADPVGLQRLVRGLDELARRPAAAGARLVVVLNRVRSSTAGPGGERALREALERYAGVQDAVLVPEDRPALDAALLAGRLLREVAPASPARRALVGLAGLVAPVPATPAPSAGAAAGVLPGVDGGRGGTHGGRRREAAGAARRGRALVRPGRRRAAAAD